jgi:hypothetical protein
MDTPEKLGMLTMQHVLKLRRHLGQVCQIPGDEQGIVREAEGPGFFDSTLPAGVAAFGSKPLSERTNKNAALCRDAATADLRMLPPPIGQDLLAGNGGAHVAGQE